jgi:hypothetical protein
LRTVVIASLLFGIAVAVIKGGDAGLRDSVGNVSAPWLLLPFFAGRSARGPLTGAAIGLLACLAALVGFYVAEAFVLDLGTHSVLRDLELTIPAGRLYFIAGVVFGPVFGTLGALRTSWTHALDAAVVGLLLIGEPLVVYLYQGAQGVSPSKSGMVTSSPALSLAEVVLGVCAAVLLLRSGVRQQRDRSRAPR